LKFTAVLINTGLQPGATGSTKEQNRFNGLHVEKAVKTAHLLLACNTRLKPCVNEMSKTG
jgi:hypothetical protein